MREYNGMHLDKPLSYSGTTFGSKPSKHFSVRPSYEPEDDSETAYPIIQIKIGSCLVMNSAERITI